MRQGDPISQLFTATIQVFKKSHLEEKGINLDGEKLLVLRFADGVALVEDGENVEHQLDTMNEVSLRLVSRCKKEKPNL